MIKKFPKYSNLDVSLYDEIKSIAGKFEPYSDFNFTSLFSWDTNATTRVSLLNGNLVVSMPDYITGEIIHSIIGNNKIDDSLVKLLGVTSNLKLIPEVVVESIVDVSKFRITEDVDNHDYIYSLEDLSALKGQAYKSKRKSIHRFKNGFSDLYEIKDIDFSDTTSYERILETFAWWASDRGHSHEDISNEHKAISRLLSISNKIKLEGSEIFINNKSVGFSIHEILNNEYTICHFHKTVLKFVGIDTFLTVYAAKELRSEGFKLENWEQDLGIPGLRQLKASYKPAKMLKKFQIKIA